MTLEGRTFSLVQESLIIWLSFSLGICVVCPAFIRSSSLAYIFSIVFQVKGMPSFLKLLVPPLSLGLDWNNAETMFFSLNKQTKNYVTACLFQGKSTHLMTWTNYKMYILVSVRVTETGLHFQPILSSCLIIKPELIKYQTVVNRTRTSRDGVPLEILIIQISEHMTPCCCRPLP